MKENMKNTLKRAVTFGLCVVMAGTVAIGSYGVEDVYGVTQDDIHAAFKDGVLTLTVPKKEAILEKEETKYIAIEG